jgi:DNA-binding SARP family transcriptional activator
MDSNDRSDTGPPSNGTLTLRLRLLGAPVLVDSGGTGLAGLGPGKTLAILAFLAVRGRARRTELIELLWGGTTEANARNAFRQSLHRLRSALGESVIPQDREMVTFVRGETLEVDRDAFVVACDEGRWREAVEGYTGDFLEALEVGELAFDQWAEAERIRLRSRFQEAVRHAGEEAIDAGLFADAVRWSDRLVALAPFDEDAAVFHATVLVTAGRPLEALAAAHSFSARLKEELDLSAPAAVQSLINRLQRSITPGSTQSAKRRAPREQMPIVGRDEELSRLIGALSDLHADRGGALVVEGPPGIGKTRILDELVARGRPLARTLFLRGHERPLGTALPYAGVVDALRPLVRAPGVAGTSRHLLAEAARLLPELRDNFDLPALPAVEDDTARVRLFEGIAALIESAAFEQSICIILDDLQNASSSTIDLVTYLVGRLQSSPVLFVLSGQTAAGASAQAHALGRLRAAAGSTLVLGPVSDEAIGTLIRAALGRGTGRDSDTDVGRLVAIAAGRPMAALELARRMDSGAAINEALVEVRDIALARLQAASPVQRRLFFVASLFDRTVSLPLLGAAAHLPEAAALDAASDLARAGLLRESETGFAVAHDLSRGFIVESSGLAGRALLAGWAADALAHEPGASDAELAHLNALAGRAAAAFEHARRAGFAAATNGGFPEAIRLFDVALTFAPDAARRAEIENLLEAFGRGSLRLPGVVAGQSVDGPIGESKPADMAAPDPTAAPDAPPTGEVAPRAAPRSGPRASPVVRSWTTRQRWLVIGALSAVALLAAAAVRHALDNRIAERTAVTDTLTVSEQTPAAGGALSLDVVARASGGALTAVSESGEASTPPQPWYDSLRAPLSGPISSPDGRVVAAKRATSHGTDVVLLAAGQRDATVVVAGGGDNAPLSWSPDGSVLLLSRARTLADGSFDTDLLAYHVDTRQLQPIDTSAAHAVTEARWSPDGARIAWVARVGLDRQRDVFVGDANGANATNLTANAADDYDIAWAPDASLLAFTSNRAGARRIYSYDFDNARLWPVTDRDGDDRARFSRDGRLLAFESTRDGDAAVYITRPLGGSVVRVTPPGQQFSIGAWHGARAPYVNRVRIIGSSTVAVGDTERLGLLALNQFGSSVPAPSVTWTLLDAGAARLASRVASTSGGTAPVVIGVAHGQARLVASVPGWRADTLALSVGTPSTVVLSDDFSENLSDAKWLALGKSRPFVGVAPGGVGGRVLFPNGDLEWDSGVLSREQFQLRPGAALSARMYAPFSGPTRAATLSIALVHAPAGTVSGTSAGPGANELAPAFTSLVGIVWDGASARFEYSVGKEVFADMLPSAPARMHVVGFSISPDGIVSFTVDGAVRWRAGLRLAGADGSAVRLWIAGHATGATAAVSDLVARLASNAPAKP